MEWLLISTGFTGALTFVYLTRVAYRWWVPPLSLAVYHSPKGGCTEAVVREIQAARREVLVQAYSCTSKPIADALIAAKGRGVSIEILLDKSNEQETYTELGHLVQQGLTPQIDAHHAIAHNKIMLIDRKTLITGSFNFTHQAEAENAENLLIIKGHRTLMESYHESFGVHKAHCQPPGARAGAKKAA
jgi:phosphatidylserine/phosphatidylglycerophosphate/cardiolipin synthase-like enzyme